MGQGAEKSRGDLCAECLKIEKANERRTFWMITGVLLVAVVGAGGLLVAMLLGTREESQSSESPQVQVQSPKPQAEPQVDADTYATRVQPEIERLRLERENVWIGIKTFLREVNAATEKSVIRARIDSFREEMRQHGERLREIEERLRKISPPIVAEQEQKRLIDGIASYRMAVEGYAEGLAAYRFERIKESQGRLEQADEEIREASASLAAALERSKSK